MSVRHLQKNIKPMRLSEGAGVTVYRSIGIPQLLNLDPFLMLDFFCSDNPNEYIAGFPDHPHRGFVTVTYMLDGHMLHEDSMGNKGDLLPGGAQWMKAASGIIHSEMPQQTRGLMRGFQLWINLPAEHKMSQPTYQEFSPAAIPEVSEGGIVARILCGEYQDRPGPIKDEITNTLYLDVKLTGKTQFDLPLDKDLQGFIYLYEGSLITANTEIDAHSLLVLGEGNEVQLTAGGDGARFILVAGKPIGEPIVQYGPFVMNSEAQIHQAIADYQNGQLIKHKAKVTGN